MTDTASDLPTHIEETVQAMAELHAQHHRRATPVERSVDRLTAFVGRPRSVGLLTFLLAAWLLVNVALAATRRAFDPPPFPYLEFTGTFLGLYITVLILITQRRQSQLSERRDQLTLELAILNEQKSAKIIELLEELRRDHPDIADRHDPQADALSVPADPHAVLGAIEETHETAEAAVVEEA